LIACFDPAKTLQGKFIFSINDHPRIRAALKGFKIASVKMKYAAGAWTGKTEAVTELLIPNF
jgi:hypothetical protein